MSYPEHPHVVPLDSQVGGHAGVLTSEDGSLIIKPAHPTEIAFYQTVVADPGFEPLRPFIPKFYGTLHLEGKVDETASAAEEDGKLKVVEVAAEVAKVLENLSHSFSKPNIIDIKLGTILYDDEASPEKRARMEKTARETTSLETGIRLTGFQVFDLTTGKAVNTPKTYGKSIKAADLPEGIARFFPFAETSETSSKSVSVDANAEKPTTGTGLPPDMLLPILELLRDDIAEIREEIAQVHMRMVGGSLLIIYEADLERARAGLKWIDEVVVKEEDEDEEETEEEDEDGKQHAGPPYLVKLIDFAHTKLEPGIGPDEGVLKGVDTVLSLLDGRIEQTRAFMEGAPAS